MNERAVYIHLERLWNLLDATGALQSLPLAQALRELVHIRTGAARDEHGALPLSLRATGLLPELDRHGYINILDARVRPDAAFAFACRILELVREAESTETETT